MRYKNGLAHRGDPKDPLRIARFTNETAKRDPLLARVPLVDLLGTFAKSHLLSFLQALASGTVYWDDTKTLMLPPPCQEALKDHLELGWFCEILKWEAVEKHEDAVRQLIAGDNMDARFALAETEIELLRVMRRSMCIVKTPPLGKSLFDAVYEHALETSGGWDKSDAASLYNFLKVVGPKQLDFLERFAPFVDWDVMCIRCQDYVLASKLDDRVPWVKTGTILLQYCSDSSARCEGPGKKSFGTQLHKDDFVRLTKYGSQLYGVEAFLGSVLEKYSSDALPECDDETLCREQFAFVVRTTKKAVSRKVVFDEFPYAELEGHLRKKLNVPDAFPSLYEQAAAATAAVEKKKRGSNAIDADATPALQWSASGELVENFAIEARARGISVGSRVKMTKDLRGMATGTSGIVLDFRTGEVVVNFDRLPSGASLENEEQKVTLKSLAVCEDDASPKNPPKKAKVETAPLPDGVPYAPLIKADTVRYIDDMVRFKMYEIYAANLPQRDSVRFLVDSDEVGFGVIAAVPFKPQAFVVVPHSKEILLATDNVDPIKPHVELKVVYGNIELQYHILAPAKIPEEKTMIPAGPDLAPIDTYIVNAFWWCRARPTHSTCSIAGKSLVQQTGEVAIPLASFNPRDNPISRAASKNQLTMHVPYLTNLREVPMGAWLTSEEKNGSVDVD